MVQPRTSLLVVAALLGAVLPGGIHSTRAQSSNPSAPYSAGTPVDVGDNWRVTVGAAAIHAAPPDSEPAGPSALLATSFVVQNMAPQPRSFPTYRVHLLNASGAAFADVWCSGVDQALELVPAIPANGTATGALCWRLPSADMDRVVVAMDPAPGSAPDQRVVFALDPVITTASPIASPLAPRPAPPGQGRTDTTDPAAVPVTQPSAAGCSSAYGLYSSSSGTYSTCATDSTRSGGTSGVPLLGSGAPPCQLYPSAVQPSGHFTDPGPGLYQLTCASTAPGSLGNAGVSICQLYPSGSQPSNSSTTTLGSATPLQAATSAAPACSLAGGGGATSTNGGAPPCRLYVSGSQPSTSTYAIPPFTLTPVAPPTVPVPSGGTLAGSTCN